MRLHGARSSQKQASVIDDKCVLEVKVKNRLVYKYQMPVFACTGEKFGLETLELSRFVEIGQYAS